MEKEQKQCGLQLPLHQDVSLPVPRGHFQYGEKGNNSRAIQRLAINCSQSQEKDKWGKKLINDSRCV
ncbi:Uncharacterised protein [Escherichia coli]|uniref:Uncharacterized protein n=1 Tax=Escherichia coli TaxID=562 RepID=A0A2X1KT85_ECOLX|nr:Uncharacterised protein [Escherichia coli]